MENHQLLKVLNEYPKLNAVFNLAGLWRGPRNPLNERWKMDEVLESVSVTRMDMSFLAEEPLGIIHECAASRTATSTRIYAVKGNEVVQVAEKPGFYRKLKVAGSEYYLLLSKPFGYLLTDHDEADYYVIVFIEESEQLPDIHEEHIHIGVVRPPKEGSVIELLRKYLLEEGKKI